MLSRSPLVKNVLAALLGDEFNAGEGYRALLRQIETRLIDPTAVFSMAPLTVDEIRTLTWLEIDLGIVALWRATGARPSLPCSKGFSKGLTKNPVSARVASNSSGTWQAPRWMRCPGKPARALRSRCNSSAWAYKTSRTGAMRSRGDLKERSKLLCSPKLAPGASASHPLPRPSPQAIRSAELSYSCFFTAPRRVSPDCT